MIWWWYLNREKHARAIVNVAGAHKHRSELLQVLGVHLLDEIGFNSLEFRVGEVGLAEVDGVEVWSSGQLVDDGWAGEGLYAWGF